MAVQKSLDPDSDDITYLALRVTVNLGSNSQQEVGRHRGVNPVVKNGSPRIWSSLGRCRGSGWSNLYMRSREAGET